MVALLTSTEGNFEASGSGEHEQGTKDHAPVWLEQESYAEGEEGSAFDSGSGASGSGRETEI